jgi:hypothetical protein
MTKCRESKVSGLFDGTQAAQSRSHRTPHSLAPERDPLGDFIPTTIRQQYALAHHAKTFNPPRCACKAHIKERLNDQIEAAFGRKPHASFLSWFHLLGLKFSLRYAPTSSVVRTTPISTTITMRPFPDLHSAFILPSPPQPRCPTKNARYPGPINVIRDSGNDRAIPGCLRRLGWVMVSQQQIEYRSDSSTPACQREPPLGAPKKGAAEEEEDPRGSCQHGKHR